MTVPAPPESRSMVRALAGVLSIVASLIILPIGFVLLVADSRYGGTLRDLTRPLTVLMAGGGLLACGIALLIWEMSIRYGIRK